MQRTAMIILTVLLSFISLFIGTAGISVLDIFHLSDYQREVMVISRIPRMLSILTAGMGLSVAGVIMQLILSNRFVSPSTGSTIEWAKLGLLSAILLFPGLSSVGQMVISLLFAFGGTLLFLYILQVIKLKDAMLVPLVGIVFGNIVNSVTTFIGYQYDMIQNVTAWLQGSFIMILQGRYEMLFISIPCLGLAMIYASRFTLISMGRDISKALGVRYMASIQIGLVIIAVISASVVVTVGVIPFVGMVIPNIVRIYRGDHLEKNIIDIALLGAVFLLISDIISRLIISPFEIPISVTVGVLGCSLFIGRLLWRGGQHEAR